MYTGRSTIMGSRRTMALRIAGPVAAGAMLALVAVWAGPATWGNLDEKLAALTETTTFDQAPIYVGQMDLKLPPGLQPFDIYSVGEQLLVSYLHSPRVDLFDSRFRLLRTLNLGPEGSSITGLAADQRYIYIADSQRGEVRIYDWDEQIQQVYGYLPGGAERLRPHGLAVGDGVLYVTDRRNKQLLAISVASIPGITEWGELLFRSDDASSGPALNVPAGVALTPDGRLLVSDHQPGAIAVFTCNGRYVYRFRLPIGESFRTPGGIAFDQIVSPALLARNDSAFVLSDINHQGRIHVADAQAGRILVFDATGEYQFNYGEELRSPSALTVQQSRRTIIVTDMGQSALVVYKY